MVESIRAACISKELKEFLDKRFRRGSQFVPELGNLLEEIQPLPECNGKEGDVSKIKKTKKRTPRMQYMSVCMKPKDKQGMGLDMKTCSVNFKEMSDAERDKYKTT